MSGGAASALRRAGAGLVAGAALLCGLQQPAPAGATAERAPVPPPARLSETGLYAADGTVDARNLPYSPQYPLWTDGAQKARWIRLPEGARIDVTDVDAWRFPTGTKLWKEFAWGGRKVETRLLWLARPDEWVFASYVWDDGQTDAALAPPEGVPDVFEIAPGRRHSIPGRNDCLACHGATPAAVLGFSALQLSDDRDPNAPHAEPLRRGDVTLRALVAADRLSPPRRELAARPPRIRAQDPTERAALGYLSANCGACHNSAGPLAPLGLDLRHRVAGELSSPEPALATTLGRPGVYRVPGVSPDSSRVVAPGAPRLSALAYRMHSRRAASQMPPLGSVIADDEALALVRRWISGLGGRGGVAASGADPAAAAPLGR